MEKLFDIELHRMVRDRYGHIARGNPHTTCCCTDSGTSTDVCTAATEEYYTEADLESVPADSNLGLGCGNPLRFAEIREGDTILDLGSGGGIDCFIAARRTGASGHVIGVDMTPEMVERARKASIKSEYANVEFRLGEIEHLPVVDASIDVVISNCVVNLSQDKRQVFREAFRVLRPGGRLAISDTIAVAAVPDSVRQDPEAFASCEAGAETETAIRGYLADAGFRDVEIRIAQTPPGEEDRYLASALLLAAKRD